MTTEIFDMFKIIKLKQEKFSQSDPVLIRPKLASVLTHSDPVLVRAHLWCTSQGIQKFSLTILCKCIKRKTKYNKGVTRTMDCLVTSLSTMLIVVRCSPNQFYVWQKTGCQRCTGSGFQDSNHAGFSTFWTNRIGSGLRFYSSFRIRIRIFKFHFWNLTPTQS